MLLEKLVQIILIRGPDKNQFGVSYTFGKIQLNIAEHISRCSVRNERSGERERTAGLSGGGGRHCRKLSCLLYCTRCPVAPAEAQDITTGLTSEAKTGNTPGEIGGKPRGGKQFRSPHLDNRLPGTGSFWKFLLQLWNCWRGIEGEQVHTSWRAGRMVPWCRRSAQILEQYYVRKN